MRSLPDLGVGPEVFPGKPVDLWPGLRRLTAPNPGLMTGPGTNTYLVGRRDVAVVDPGPDDPDHVAAIIQAVSAEGGRVRWVLVTHTHADHAPAAAALARLTGAQMIGFDGRDGFHPDVSVGEGWTLHRPDLALRAVHTPGHASNHLCWLVEPDGVLLSGDHVMDGSTVVIRPPDGDMAQYLGSLRDLLRRSPPIAAIGPGHGRVIGDPIACLEGIVTHRLRREEVVLDALGRLGHEATIDELLPSVYADVDDEHRKVGRDSLWAHLRKLTSDGLVVRLEPTSNSEPTSSTTDPIPVEADRAAAEQAESNEREPEHPDLRARWTLTPRDTPVRTAPTA